MADPGGVRRQESEVRSQKIEDRKLEEEREFHVLDGCRSFILLTPDFWLLTPPLFSYTKFPCFPGLPLSIVFSSPE